ncbi:MAG: branched-chain alpha-keto acid dehydrogenase subunit E2 [Spirochaetaceae bacterium]|nr:MAG: branched-chain alpha-keto acid dehydrogenase subunit E2 [Spirochaetaceae bacterium]
MQEVTLPEISENVESAMVISVLVSKGDRVEADQALLEIETDKATAEVPAPAAGSVSEVLVAEGDEIKVGAVIAKIDTADGSSTEDDSSSDDGGKTESEQGAEASAEAEPEAEPESEPEEEPDRAPEAERQDTHRVPPTVGGSVPASPSTRRLAREIGVDIAEVHGSGPAGRISADDVKRHAREERGGSAAPAAARHPAEAGMTSAFSLPDFSKWGPTRREKLNSVRRITGENTQAAWQTIPHVTQFDEADVTALEQFRQKHARRAEKSGVKLTVTAILIKVVARALQRFPRFNASLDAAAGEIIYKDFINISVAADTDRGLLVPVVRDVNQKSIITLSGELGELAARARDKKIKPEEMQGGTFTISNLGGIGGTAFTPVVFAPQVAILGVARTQTRPVWQDERFVPRLMLPLSLSYDHRVIDGADGARFVRWICEALEQPLFMDLEGEHDE